MTSFAKDKREIEVKFLIKDMKGLERRLLEANARYSQARTHELNLRFDTPDGKLSQDQCVLRLRKDNRVRITYKGPMSEEGGIADREEIEFEASNYEAAKHLLESLGYEVMVIYEKYRTIYDIDKTIITLDEMPFGNFVEIEGPDVESIKEAAELIGLDWEQRSAETYLGYFLQIKEKAGLDFHDLTFENFEKADVDVGVLELEAAD
ncbi:MAG: class IV adenylate cyclase [Chloroflexi bacterium]|nr:class IV adenylate cyclase [Chloroflexota bacterium]